MENNTNIGERIQQFIDFKKITINDFSKGISSNSYFNKVIKNNGAVGSGMLENILRKYPEVNIEWLITGEGNMLRNPKQIAINQAEIENLRSEIIDLQNRLINCLENRLFNNHQHQPKKTN